MADLITLTQLKDYLGVTHADDDALLGALITDVSALIEQHVGRTLAAVESLELVDGGNAGLLLPNRPVVAVHAVIDAFDAIERVTNPAFLADADDWTLGTNWLHAGNQIRTTAASAGIVSQSIQAFAEGDVFLARVQIAQVTAGTLTARIGDGASVNVSGAARSAAGEFLELLTAENAGSVFSLLPSADFQGAVDFASLSDVTSGLVPPGDYDVDQSRGMIFLVPDGASDFWYSREPSECDDVVWRRGRRRWLVHCTAGPSSVPIDIQHAAKIWCVAKLEQRNPAAAAQNQGDSRLETERGMPTEVRQILSAHREVHI